MALPTLSQSVKLSAQTIVEFKGLSKNTVIEDGELSDMVNLSSRYYPCLSPREPRKKINTLTNAQDLIAYGDKLFYIADQKFYCDGVEKGTVKAGPKSMAVMNDYVVIFPDKVQYDILRDTFKPMESSLTSSGVKFTENDVTITSGSFIAAGFEVGDGILITGCSTHPYNNRSVVIETVTEKKITVGSKVFESSETTAEAGIVTFKRAVPDLDYVIECNNRLWGCQGNKMIYCSQQGSHRNFNVFSGLVTDSYYVEVGTAGNFTGAMTYNNYPYFFKENHIHKIYGFSPTQFQVITMNVQGVKKGCSKSLAVTNNLMFYVARDGVMVFDSTAPSLISEKLGYIKYDEAVAGGTRKYYYVCLRKGTAWEMICYDSDLGLWHKEDQTHALGFTYYDGELIYLNEKGEVYQVNSEEKGEVVSWSATTGEMNPFYQDKKGIIKLKLRVELEANSNLSIFISHDNGPFKHIKTLHSLKKTTEYLPIQPQRCDYFRVKLEGKGECKVYHIIKEFYQGSEV